MAFMGISKNDKLKIEILKKLSENGHEMSLNSLRAELGGLNYYKVKNNCDFLELLGYIKNEKKGIRSVEYNFISITDKGIDLILEFKK